MNNKPCIVHVNTYPPRECGIATFSADLIRNLEELFSDKVDNKIVAMNTGLPPQYKYDDKVIMEINQNDKTAYIETARKINVMPEVKLVSVQHEYGIFGDNYGENIILFLKELQKPASVTFHTVLPTPSEGMKSVTMEIISLADRIIVMTDLAKQFLINTYQTSADKIRVIPHGIHPQIYTDSKAAKKKLGLENKTIIMTFGLLGRGKGIEYGIEAMPKIIEKYPEAIYLVVGGTHPVVLRNEGEVYRNELTEKTKKLAIENNVIFHNKYVSTTELLTYLEATDIYLCLSQEPNQAVSGTLTYALGAGRAVVSTPFMQAKEIITNDVGILVDFKEHTGIEHAILNLLEDVEKRLSMGKSAYFNTRIMTWPNVALAFMRTFSEILPTITETNKSLQPIKIDYLKKLTDEFGLLQFADLNNPNPRWGYTLDDNARALVAMCWYDKKYPSQENQFLLDTYMKFIERSQKHDGGFNNYFDTNKGPYDEMNKGVNLEDSNARAIWAAALASTSLENKDIRDRSLKVFEKELSNHQKIHSPRAVAFYIKAFAEYYLHHKNSEDAYKRIEQYADFLVDIFHDASDDKWRWFEHTLTYSNGVLPEALLIAYEITQKPSYLTVGKETLDFLANHSFEGDMCSPVGQAGWYKKGGQKIRYDQQPEEVSALVLALKKMFFISKDKKYHKQMSLAFDWFLGNNISKQLVYTHATGGCYDGIRLKGINLNQGAESTVSYLLARLAIETTDLE